MTNKKVTLIASILGVLLSFSLVSCGTQKQEIGSDTAKAATEGSTDSNTEKADTTENTANKDKSKVVADVTIKSDGTTVVSKPSSAKLSDKDYPTEVNTDIIGALKSIEYGKDLWKKAVADPSIMKTEDFKKNINVSVVDANSFFDRLRAVNPPDKYTEGHKELLIAFDYFKKGLEGWTKAANDENITEKDNVEDMFTAGNKNMQDATKTLAGEQK